ncbi:hypothetical protein [Microbulbifer variabilis]|uniref:hypothetical protein n=1 Tax=Microbulbifer variabilis TaxID=266805 RepID=UPI000363624C|nr:hypothetical protein [Microbulbifer variabilis]
MRIACLGWGSLIWKPDNLQLSSDWASDGPNLPIEFARESADGRMTLVLVDNAIQSPTLWAMLSATDIDTAISDLAKREKISEKNKKYSIGYWESYSCTSHGKYSDEISKWAIEKGLDGVVWTNLKYGFQTARNQIPTSDEVIKHLKELPIEKKRKAEEYVRKTPLQVRTNYRNVIENKLGWFPVSGNA